MDSLEPLTRARALNDYLERIRAFDAVGGIPGFSGPYPWDKSAAKPAPGPDALAGPELSPSSLGMSTAQALGLLLLEFEEAPLRSLGAAWWELLAPGSRSPFRLEEVPERLLELTTRYGWGVAGPVEAEEAGEFLAQVWSESRDRAREREASLDEEREALGQEYWAPMSAEAIEAFQRRRQWVEAEAELRLQALELGLARVRREDRWPLFEAQLREVEGPPGSELSGLSWPRLGGLGHAVTLWLWCAGVVQRMALDLLQPLRPRHLPAVAERVHGPLAELDVQLALVERAFSRGGRVGSYGLQWLVRELYGPCGLWGPVPSMRSPIAEPLRAVLAAIESIEETPLPGTAPMSLRSPRPQVFGLGSGAGSGAGAAREPMLRPEAEDDLQLWGPAGGPGSALNALAVGAAAVLERLLRLQRRGRVASGAPVVELLEPAFLDAADLLAAHPQQQAQLLAAQAGVAERDRRFPMEQRTLTPLTGFEFPLLRELVPSLGALFLRHGAALVVGRFTREPALLRQEFSAWALFRLAQRDGMTASALQERLEPLPAALRAQLGGQGPERLRAACRPWLEPLGFPACGQWPADGLLPQLSQAQWQDWRVREVLVPLARAVLAELYGQLQVATARKVAEHEQRLEGDQRERLEFARQVVAAAKRLKTAEGQREWEAELLRLRSLRSAGWSEQAARQEEMAFDHWFAALDAERLAAAEAMVLEGEGGVSSRASVSVGLLSYLGDLEPAQQLELQASGWLDAVLPGPVVRLRPFLVELGRLSLERQCPPLAQLLPPLAVQLGVSEAVLGQWLEGQPFSAAEAQELALLVARGKLPVARFGSLSETLLADEAGFCPLWLTRAFWREAG